MDISTGSWFEYLREEVLTEGLRDIGLPESVVDFIESAMPNAPEKAKTYGQYVEEVRVEPQRKNLRSKKLGRFYGKNLQGRDSVHQPRG